MATCQIHINDQVNYLNNNASQTRSHINIDQSLSGSFFCSFKNQNQNMQKF